MSAQNTSPDTPSGASPGGAHRRAASPSHSVWVSASAGSGKTKALVDRTLALLLAGTPPERILCITFTRAAAAEMANRLRQILSQWAMASEEHLRNDLAALPHNHSGDDDMAARTRRARQLFARVLDAPSGMKIRTIHSFCESILGRFPLEAGVPPYFQVVDDREEASMRARARNTVLTAAADDDGGALAAAVKALAKHAPEERFDALIQALLQGQNRLRALLGDDFGGGGLETAVARVFATMDADPSQSPDSILRDACADEAFDRPALSRAAEALQSANGKRDPDRGRALAQWLAADVTARTAAFDADYASIFLTAEGEPRKQLATAPTLKEMPTAVDVLAAEAQRILDTRARINAHETAAASAALLRLGAAVLRAHAREKRARGLLDYDDLILRTQALLSGERDSAAWVLFKLDGGLDHILIDEAQDTSPAQWEIIRALAEEFFAGQGRHADRAAGTTPDGRPPPRTIFAVGDLKQSIFSFQGADPDAFQDMRAHFRARATDAAAGWRDVPLDMSFRSSAAVLRAVDGVFADADAVDGVADAESGDIRHHVHRTGQAGQVAVWPLFRAEKPSKPDPWTPPIRREDTLSPRVRLAEHIARTVSGWLGRERLPARNRAMRPGDVLILVRRRAGLVDHLMRALKARGVPVAGADRMILADQIEVMDLVALGQWLLLPEDDLTLATVLKTPLAGLNDDDLFTLAHGREGASLWRRLERAARSDARMEAVRAWLADLLSHADWQSPFALFSRALARPCPAVDAAASPPLSGWRAITRRFGEEAQDPLEEFLALALRHEKTGPSTLQSFLHWFGAAQTQIKRDMDVAGGGEVRIMTVHGAKGLQAPVVILPDAASMPRAGRNETVHWVPPSSSGRAVPIWTPRVKMRVGPAEHAAAQARAAEMREYRRLLYVAMTRAEDRLIICGAAGKSYGEETHWHTLAERGLRASGAVEKPFGVADADGKTEKMLVLETPQTAESDKETPPAEQSAPVRDAAPEWLRAPPPEEPEQPMLVYPSTMPEPDRPRAAPDGGENATPKPLDMAGRERGRLIHRLLQILPNVAAEDRRVAGNKLLAALAREKSVAWRGTLLAEVLGTLDDPALETLFGPDSRAEVPLVGVARDAAGTLQRISGRVDRLAVLPDRIMVVDYKTTPAVPSPDRIPAAHQRQMAAYRAVMARMWPGRPVECLLVWTAGPSVTRLESASLDRFYPAS